jgi:phosphate transport system substrate-binding protein
MSLIPRAQTRRLLLGLGLALAAAGPGPAAQLHPGVIVVDGSTTVGPLAKAFAEHFMALHPDVNVTVSESGSGNGAKGLINGACDVADMSRFMKAEEFKAAVEKGVLPVAHVVAMDGIAVIVHPSNPVLRITTAQLRDVFVGKITSWKGLGGPDRPIVVVSRDTNSGTFETFDQRVLSAEKMAGTVEYLGSNGAIRQKVQGTPGAIGYVGLGFVDASVKALAVDGIEATPETVASGIYPIARPLFMFTNGYPEPGGALHEFVTLYLTPKGQELVEAIGFVPVTRY